MFCSKCGTKNAKGAKFCKSCGEKIKEAVKTNKTNETKETKNGKENKQSNTSKKNNNNLKEFLQKNKLPVIIVGIIVFLLVVYLIVNSTVFSAKSFATKYAKSVIENDYVSQIEYADVYGTSDFITKDIVKNKYKDEKKKNIEQIRMLKDNELEKLSSTGSSTIDKFVEDILKEKTDKKSSLTKSYTFEYLTSDSKKSEYVTVSISKASHKKYGIFNNWKALGDDVVAEDVTVETDPNTTVTVEGVKLSSKYLDKSKSSKTKNVYKIPSILKDKVDITITLKNGLVLEDSKNVYSKEDINTTRTYGYKLTKDSSKKLKTVVQNFLDGYVSAAISKKDISEVRNNKIWDKEILEISSFDTYYNDLVKRYESDQIESYKVTDIDVSSSYIDSDGEINVRATVKYSYKYKDDSSKSKKEGNSSTSIRLDLNSENKDLTITDFYSYGVRYMF